MQYFRHGSNVLKFSVMTHNVLYICFYTFKFKTKENPAFIQFNMILNKCAVTSVIYIQNALMLSNTPKG